MPPIKAIIHEATFLLRAATDGKPTVVVIVGTGVPKQREKEEKKKKEIQVTNSHVCCVTQLWIT